jgi:hypothetical protein
VSVWLTFTTYIFVIEKKRGLNVFTQGREYVRGYWGSIFARGLLLCLCVSVPILLISLIALGIFGTAGWLVSASVLGILAYPFYLAYFYVLYQNITVLKPELPNTQATTSRGFLKASAIVGVVVGVGLICLAIFLIHLGNSQKGQQNFLNTPANGG